MNNNIGKVLFSGLLDTRDAVEQSFGTITKKYPNNDLLYGPYTSISEAFSTLSETSIAGANALVQGKTVGIIQDGVIKEYWLEGTGTGGTYTQSDLVPKIPEQSDGSSIDISGKQDVIDSSNKLNADYVDDTTSVNKFTTAAEKAAWDAKYSKPSGGIPTSDLAGNIATKSGSITNGHLASFDSSGNLVDSGKLTTDYDVVGAAAAVKTELLGVVNPSSISYYNTFKRVDDAIGSAYDPSKGTIQTRLGQLETKVGSIPSSGSEYDHESALGSIYDLQNQTGFITNGPAPAGSLVDRVSTLESSRTSFESNVNAAIAQQSAAIAVMNGGNVIVVADVTALQASDIDTTAIYRQYGSSSYTDYMCTDTTTTPPTWQALATYSIPGIDNVPTKNSQLLVKSGGIYDSINKSIIYDVSENNLDQSNNPTKYEAITNAINAVPNLDRFGGMIIKFIMLHQAQYNITIEQDHEGAPQSGSQLSEFPDISVNFNGEINEEDLLDSGIVTNVTIPQSVGDSSVFYYPHVSDENVYYVWTVEKLSDEQTWYEYWMYQNVYTNDASGNAAFADTQNWQKIAADSTPTSGSKNFVQSGGVYTAINSVQQLINNCLVRPHTSSTDSTSTNDDDRIAFFNGEDIEVDNNYTKGTISNLASQLGGYSLVVCTAAQYEQLVSVDPNTLYFITESRTPMPENPDNSEE